MAGCLVIFVLYTFELRLIPVRLVIYGDIHLHFLLPTLSLSPFQLIVGPMSLCFGRFVAMEKQKGNHTDFQCSGFSRLWIVPTHLFKGSVREVALFSHLHNPKLITKVNPVQNNIMWYLPYQQLYWKLYPRASMWLLSMILLPNPTTACGKLCQEPTLSSPQPHVIIKWDVCVFPSWSVNCPNNVPFIFVSSGPSAGHVAIIPKYLLKIKLK